MSSYKKDIPSNITDWKKWKEQKKAQKRKWKEDTLIKQLEKQQKCAESADRLQQESHRQPSERGRHYTVAIAVPGSILDNAQTPELKTYLAGQIARAAVVFKVDEIVIFDETGTTKSISENDVDNLSRRGNCNLQMARILQYLECPQYLRKNFFPKHKDLENAGLLNPLDCPHHMRAEDESLYREGVVLDVPTKDGKGSYVNIGLLKNCQIDKTLQAGVRVTVKVDKDKEGKKKARGTVVPPSRPREEDGLYWGYSVRLASSLGSVFTECPHGDGYDVTIGTSERGDCVDGLEMPATLKHLLVVFGGLKGLEASLDADQALQADDPRFLFDYYLNTCPNQGSNTIRTEEAILVTMSALRPKLPQSSLHRNVKEKT